MVENQSRDSKWLDILAIAISVLALFAGIASPFIAYRWLQNDVRVQQIKADSIRAISFGASSVDGDQPDSVVTMTHSIRFANHGTLPVDKVETIFECQAGADFFKDIEVEIVPPREFSKAIEGTSMIVTFKDPIPPNEDVTVTIVKKARFDRGFSEIIGMWIRSEALPTIPVPSFDEPKRK